MCGSYGTNKAAMLYLWYLQMQGTKCNCWKNKNIKPDTKLLKEEMQWWIQDFLEVGRQPSKGVPTYDFAKFPPKLHESERIWTRGRGHWNSIYIQLKILLYLQHQTHKDTCNNTYKYRLHFWSSMNLVVWDFYYRRFLVQNCIILMG